MRLSDRTDSKVPPETPGEGFEVHESLRIDEVLAPLTDVLPEAFWRADVEVLRLKVHCQSKDVSFWIRPYRADPAVPPRRAAGEAAEADTDDSDSDDLGRSSGSDGARDKMSDLSQSDKDALSFCSSGDSEVEMDPGTAGEESEAAAAIPDASDSGEESEPPNPRASRHTHTAWQNDYFVLTDNRNYPDVRMSVKGRWKGIADLGSTCGSKTLVPGHYGDDRAEPDQVILALKAWMIHRWQQNHGRFLQRGARRRAWEREVESLRHEIGKRGGALALHPKTRERLGEWAPMTLA